MTNLPPSPFFDSGTSVTTPPDETAAPLRQVEHAAVEYVDLDQTDCIGEIFVGARKLDQPRFVLDVEQFMLDIEEKPLFLQRAG